MSISKNILYVNNHQLNRIRGKQNRASGEIFENYITAACTHYQIAGKAIIEKTPEPMKVLRRLQGGQFIACFEKKAQPDYKGTTSGGHTIVFEAKHTDEDRIDQSRVSKTQSDSLDRYSEMGAACFILVSIRMQLFYRIPWSVWKTMKQNYGRKYITTEELKQYQVPFTNGIIHFLKTGKGEL